MTTSPPITLRAAFGLVVFCTVAFVVLYMVTGGGGYAPIPDTLRDAFITSAAMLLPCMLVSTNVEPARIVFWPQQDAHRWPLIAAGFFLSFPLVMAQWGVIDGSIALGLPVWVPDADEDLKAQGLAHFGLLMLEVALLTAIAEEALFRGLFQPAAVHRLGVHGGIWLSAIFFSLLHIEPANVLSGILLFGPVIGYLRYRAGNLAPCIALHAGNNLLALLFTNWESVYDYIPWLVALSLPALFISVVLFQRVGVLPTRAARVGEPVPASDQAA